MEPNSDDDYVDEDEEGEEKEEEVDDDDESEADHDEDVMGAACDLLQEIGRVYGDAFLEYVS